MSEQTKEITVQGVLVSIATPYAEGHSCTVAEAKALNQVRAENIGNNTRKRIKELLEAKGGDTEAVKAEAQKIVSEVDAGYEFTLASAGGSTRVDPLTKECRRIAKDLIARKIKEEGLTQKEYLEKKGPDAIKELIAQYEGHEAIVKAAKDSLKRREALEAAI